MKKIIFISNNLTERLIKQIYSLNKLKIFKIYLAVAYEGNNSVKNFVEEIYHYGSKNKIKSIQKRGFFGESIYDLEAKNLLSILKNKEFDLIHFHTPPNRPFEKIIHKLDCPYILDIYDPINFYEKSRIYTSKELKSEKILLENCSAIVTKFPEELYQEYQKIGVNILDKPRLVFPDYCTDINIVETNYSKNKKNSLVYCGSCDYPFLPKKYAGNNIFIDVCKVLLPEKFNITLISSIFQNKYSNNILNQKYLALKKKYPSLSLMQHINNPKLQQVISNYDFGLQLHDFSKTGHNKIFELTSFGNKFFTYLEAGLPIIVNSELKWNSEWVNTFNTGISIPFKNIVELPRIISEYDIQKAKKNISILSRTELNMKNNINKLVKFYQILI